MGKATLRLVSSISATYKRMRVYQRIERFSTDDCRKTKTKAITPTNHNRNEERDEPITIPSNYIELEAREESCAHGAIGFGFASHWLKNWRESFKPITKCSNRNHVITFDSHLKTALSCVSCFRVQKGGKDKREGSFLFSSLLFRSLHFERRRLVKIKTWKLEKEIRNTRRRRLIFQSIILFFLAIFSHIRLSHT